MVLGMSLYARSEHGPEAERGNRVTGARPDTRSCHQGQTGKLTGSASHHRHNWFRAAFFAPTRQAVPGIDSVTWDMYDHQPVPIPNRPQLLATTVLLLTAAFVASAWIKPPFGVWWRRAVVIGYLVAFAVVLVWITAWLIGLSNPN
jgi:hypothetical protein